MGVLEVIIGIVIALLSIVIILAVLLQQGRRSGISGTISGAADTFFSKNQAKTIDAKVSRLTKYLAILFAILALVANYIALK